MFRNKASQKVTFLVIDISTNTPKTGDAANLTAYVSKDDGAVTALGDTSATELDATNAPGLYSFDITQTESNADKLVFSGKSSTANVRVVPFTIYTLPSNLTSLLINSSNGAISLVDNVSGGTVDNVTNGVNVSSLGGSTTPLARMAAFWNAVRIVTVVTSTFTPTTTQFETDQTINDSDPYNEQVAYGLDGDNAGMTVRIVGYAFTNSKVKLTVDTLNTAPSNGHRFLIMGRIEQ